MPSDAIWAWSIIVAATAGVIIRPFRLPEAIWAVLGAGALVLLGFLPWQDALTGIEKGVDVYLFLIGMMLIASSPGSKACSTISQPLRWNMRPARRSGCSC